MAEVIGLIASLFTLAGTAATLSLKLFECGSTLKSAYNDFDGLASDVSDLSNVLENVGEILKTHQSRIVTRTVQDLARQMERCETVIEQLKITAELASRKSARVQWLFRKSKTLEMRYSLEGFKPKMSMVMITILLSKSLDTDAAREHDPLNRRTSAATRRNISRLQSAVLSNARVLNKLKEVEKQNAAEEVYIRELPADNIEYIHELPTDSDPGLSQHRVNTPYEAAAHSSWASYSPYTPIYSQEEPADALQKAREDILHELEGTRASMAMETILVGGTGTTPTWETVLLRSYDQLSKEPPASETLILLPWYDTKPTVSGSEAALESQYSPYVEFINTENSSNVGKTEPESDKEVGTLLKEWTKLSEEALGLFRHREQVQTNSENVPSWVAEEYTYRGGDQNNPTNWDPKPEQPVRPSLRGPLTRTAYDIVGRDQEPLCEVLSARGGSFVWRYEDGNQRDYYVGHQKVLEYKIKPPNNLLTEEQTANRTILSKQWISKAILEEGSYVYKDYGEGGWVIQRKLTPSEVYNLHIQSSNRTEKLLRRLARQDSQKQLAQPKRYAFAMHTFVPQTADPGEMPFEAGDTLTVLKSEGDWWLAEHDGRTGRIPANFVKLLTGFHGLAIALHPYVPRQPDATLLGFNSGTLLYLLETEGDWWLASYDGKTGRFPKNYVKVVSEPEMKNAEPAITKTESCSHSAQNTGHENTAETSPSPSPFASQPDLPSHSSPRASKNSRVKTKSAFRDAMESYIKKYGKTSRKAD